MMYLKVHKTEKGDMIALCDEEILGKILREGKKELDLKTYSDFYRGDLCTNEQADKLLSFDTLYSANIVGEESVNIVIKKGLVGKSQVMKIAKVPYVHVYTMI
ncbi:MAG: DUF424 family protein [Candidatus Micrarchaeota archaeon]|nr:DUF424 family protein [Candidatus Micrarchaeota archaeon]MDE1847525.1 DUF424 family protein [Candidatus Micrarchaeota archaeon]MDE1863839.1 DUF424 family protein [Candidatus Micrarchaeota archaeon]